MTTVSQPLFHNHQGKRLKSEGHQHNASTAMGITATLATGKASALLTTL